MFDVKEIGGYGTGLLGDVEITDGATAKLNSYAHIVVTDGLRVKLDFENALLGDYEKFEVGIEIMIHASAGKGTNLGKWCIRKIVEVNDDWLTLNDELGFDTTDLFLQAITFANFDCLKLNQDAVVFPATYDPHKFCGGILLIKCINTLKCSGGKISLTNCGIPTNWKDTLRGESSERFALNSGDGIAFIVSRETIFSEGTRIGNISSHGYEGDLPSNLTDIGGGKLFLATKAIQGFDAKVLALHRAVNNSAFSTGKGERFAYIATESILNSGLKMSKLYTADLMHKADRFDDSYRLIFDAGKTAEVTNPHFQLTNSADIVQIVGDDNLYFENATKAGLAEIVEGAYILTFNRNNKAELSKIVELEGDRIKIDKPVENAEKLVTVARMAGVHFSNTSREDFIAICADEVTIANTTFNAPVFIIAHTILLDSISRFNAPVVFICDELTGSNDFNSGFNFVFVRGE